MIKGQIQLTPKASTTNRLILKAQPNKIGELNWELQWSSHHFTNTTDHVVYSTTWHP